MTCGYCEEAIGSDEAYIYKWFPGQEKMLPVHAYHLNTKGKQDGE